MEILIGTNHLALMAGSELICLELAHYFRSLGHRVTLFANVASDPMARMFKSLLGLGIVTDPRAIAPFSYDVVYLQHHVAGLFDYRLDSASRERTAFVFGKLGRRTFMESGGWRFDRLLADAYFANSVETARRLKELEVTAPVSVFYNAAPSAYFRPPPEAARKLGRITVITNHLDPALATALDQLSPDIEVERIGLQFRQRLVSPELIGRSDLVISIGKTIPYALAARVPVYVYDHFGGPGYLTADNFALAARFNFTGRCCERRLGPGELAREITAGYTAADAFARALGDSMLERYRLEPYLDAMLAVPPSQNAARAEKLTRDPMIAQERLLAADLREHWRNAQNQQRQGLRLRHSVRRWLAAGRRWTRHTARKGLHKLRKLPQSFSA